MNWRVVAIATLSALAVVALLSAVVATLTFIADTFGMAWALTALGVGVSVGFGLSMGVE